MGYRTDTIAIVSDTAFDFGRAIRVLCGAADAFVQAYVSGRLVEAQRPIGGTAQFVLHDVDDTETVLFLAVDEADAKTNYWAEAFPAAAANGNRICIRVLKRMTYGSQDVLAVCRGDAGNSVDEADTVVYQGALFPNANGLIGFGYGFGDSFGYDAANAVGFGCGFGYQFGFGCDFVEVVTGPLPPGKYPVKAVIEDEHGNESTAWTEYVMLRTYARPAADLVIDSYDKDTDTLTLSYTASPDI